MTSCPPVSVSLAQHFSAELETKVTEYNAKFYNDGPSPFTFKTLCQTDVDTTVRRHKIGMPS